ncbi:DUF7693 family protein [Pseudomonas sp. PhalM4]
MSNEGALAVLQAVHGWSRAVTPGVTGVAFAEVWVMGWLSGDRVLERLRGVLEGRVEVKLADPAISASGVDHGIVAFVLDGMRVAFYFDCGDLDYCEWAETPEGDRGEI